MRQARLLCLPVALLFVASCAHMTVPVGGPPSTPAADSVHCPGGNGRANVRGPIICIDANTLAANPDHQHVQRGAWIHFYLTDINQELDIDFDEPVKVQYKGRRGNECWLRVKDDADVGRAKYATINVTTRKRNDPDIMIDP